MARDKTLGEISVARDEYQQLIARSRPPYQLPIPYGWFAVSFSDQLAAKQSKPLRYFDTDLVMFRTESGRAAVLDAYCPHLGAHLGYGIHEEVGHGGRIEGETIVCPFHAWRFDTDGNCVEVPYASKIPPRARDQACLRAWPTRDANGAIYVWHHPAGVAPMWEIEDYEETNSEEWGEQTRFEWIVKTHPQEMAENAADPAHFRYVHRTAAVPEWDIKYRQHCSKSEQQVGFQTPRGVVNGYIRASSEGPGQGNTRFSGLCETFLMGLTTPIDSNTTHMRFAFTQHRDSQGGGVAKGLIRDIVGQFEEDKAIWENKRYRAAPTLSDGDGPIARFRKWYRQFYHDFDPAQLQHAA